MTGVRPAPIRHPTADQVARALVMATGMLGEAGVLNCAPGRFLYGGAQPPLQGQWAVLAALIEAYPEADHARLARYVGLGRFGYAELRMGLRCVRERLTAMQSLRLYCEVSPRSLR